MRGGRKRQPRKGWQGKAEEGKDARSERGVEAKATAAAVYFRGPGQPKGYEE